jgi:hypothetical protein
VLEFHLGANLHYVPLTEAGVLQRLLGDDGSTRAAALRSSMEAAIRVALPPPIRLGPDDIAALRDVLCPDLFIGFPALSGLQSAVCRGEANYVFRDA